MVVDITKMMQLLSVAKCPACDGSGMLAHGPDEDSGYFWIECQWCSERKSMVEAVDMDPIPVDEFMLDPHSRSE